MSWQEDVSQKYNTFEDGLVSADKDIFHRNLSEPSYDRGIIMVDTRWVDYTWDTNVVLSDLDILKAGTLASIDITINTNALLHFGLRLS